MQMDWSLDWIGSFQHFLSAQGFGGNGCRPEGQRTQKNAFVAHKGHSKKIIRDQSKI